MYRHELARLFRPLTVGALLFTAACGGDDASMSATPEDVDSDAPAVVTEEEAASFQPSEDGVLTDEQVVAYLKTTLLQYDLVRKEGAAFHANLKEMEEREQKGGTLNALRNAAAGVSTMMQVTDLVGGSYVRSARTLGYNPAEMEWVRERMGEVSTHLMMKPMQEAAVRGAADLRAQAETYREQLRNGTAEGFTEADVQNMLEIAEGALADAGTQDVDPSVLRNIEVLRATRPAVTEPMWTGLGMAGSVTGLAAISGLADPNDAEAQKKLDELRALFEDALNNRVTPGMEASAPAAP